MLLPNCLLTYMLAVLFFLSGAFAITYDTYAPIRVKCPADQQWIRPAKGISAEESAWVSGRKSVVANALESYLQRLEITGLDVPKLLSAMRKDNNMRVPTISMAISGGGWLSGYTGTAIMRAFDDRFPDANKQHTGGLLQSLTYLAGLSGGSWPVMSLATNNFPSINELIADWHVDIDRFVNPPNDSIYAANDTVIFEQIATKYKAGFNISITDLTGRSFGYGFAPPPDGGMNVTLSGVRKLSNFQNYSMPMPLFQAARLTKDDAQFFGIKVPFWNSSLFEMTPFEFGTWEDNANLGLGTGFLPMEYLGTTIENGTVLNSSMCVMGYDRASFIMGTAAGAFNFWYISSRSNGTEGHFSKRDTLEPSLMKRTLPFPTAEVNAILNAFKEAFNFTTVESMYPTVPNPYVGLKEAETEKDLLLTDESEAGQALPLWSLIQNGRNSDFIMAWDNDADQDPYEWSNGTNLYDTYIQARRENLPFPEVPPPATFLKRNYTLKPTLFGCNPKYTTTGDLRSPIIMYMSGAPYSAFTNYTWYQTTFTPVQMHEIMVNGFDYITQGNGTLDKDWVKCIGCAAIDRSVMKLGMERVEECEKCFEKHCWDGTYEDEWDIPVLDPVMALQPNISYAEWNASHGWY